MSFGQISNRLPRTFLTIPGRGGTFQVEFIMDTGFDGELSLPSNLASRLDYVDESWRSLKLANGDIVVAPYYEIDLL